MKTDWLKDATKAGVFHLSADARELAGAAASSGLMVIYVDIHHAHDKDDFMAEASRALRFPEQAGAGWDDFARGLKDPRVTGFITVTGAKMSEAALTDSTTAIDSPLATLRPTCGTSTNTTSPSCSWA